MFQAESHINEGPTSDQGPSEAGSSEFPVLPTLARISVRDLYDVACLLDRARWNAHFLYQGLIAYNNERLYLGRSLTSVPFSLMSL
jgi:hypothetical protein